MWQVLERVKGRGKQVGISLELETPVELIRGFRGKLDAVVLMGTAMGVKGCGLDERACDRLSAIAALLEGYTTDLVADGGIRETTVPRCCGMPAQRLSFRGR